MSAPLHLDDLRDALRRALAGCAVRPRRVLLIHPDYSRNDFTHLVAPLLHDLLAERGLERLDTLNASGTHRAMTRDELAAKLGLDPGRHPRVGSLFNHEYDDPAQLTDAGE